MEVGQIVKFRDPISKEEAQETFEVLELRGDRVLVGFICDMTIVPTLVYLESDLISAHGAH